MEEEGKAAVEWAALAVALSSCAGAAPLQRRGPFINHVVVEGEEGINIHPNML